MRQQRKLHDTWYENENVPMLFQNPLRKLKFQNPLRKLRKLTEEGKR